MLKNNLQFIVEILLMSFFLILLFLLYLGTGSPFSRTGSQKFSSMHSYVLRTYWNNKVNGEYMIGLLVDLEIRSHSIFLLKSVSFYKPVLSETPNRPIISFPLTFML